MRDGGRPDFPPLDGLDRLWTAWEATGRTTGLEPLRWSEVEAYGRINGLAPDEMLILRRMSEAYLDGLSRTHPLAREPMDETDGNPYI